MNLVALAGVFVPIVALLGGFCMIIFLRKFQNDERMAMIDKGMSPIIPKSTQILNPSVTFRFSLLAIGAGIGIIGGNMIEKYLGNEDVAYFSMVLIFGGLGLLISYIYELKMIKKQREEEKKGEPLI